MSNNTGNENHGTGSPPDIEIRLRENDAFDSDGLDGASQETTEGESLIDKIARLEASVKQLTMGSQDAPRPLLDERALSASLGYKLPKLEAPVFYGRKHNDLKEVLRWTSEAKIYMKDRFADDEARWLREVKLLFRENARFWYDYTVRHQGLFESWDKLTQAVFRKYAGAKTADALFEQFESLKMKSAEDFDNHVESFNELLDQLELMGEKSTETHIFRVFVNSLTPGFKAKALEYQQDYHVKEMTNPESLVCGRLEGLIAYLFSWSSSLLSSSSTEVVINYMGGQERKTKKKKKKTYGKGLCKCCGAPWDPTHFCAKAAERYGKLCSRCGKDQLALGHRCSCWTTKGGQSTSLQHCEVASPDKKELTTKESGDRSGTGDFIYEKTPEPPLESNSNKNDIVEESHSTAALTKAGVHFGDCVSKDRDLYHLQESKKDDKGLIFSFDGYIKGYRVRILMDSGAEENFVAETFLARTSGLNVKTGRPLVLKLPDGSSGGNITQVLNCSLRIVQNGAQECVTHVALRVAPLNSKYDVYLGQPWLKARGVSLCYQTMSVLLRRPIQRVLHAQEDELLLTAPTMERTCQSASDVDEIYMIHVSTRREQPLDRAKDEKSLHALEMGSEQEDHLEFLQELKTSYGEIMLEGQLPPDASEGRPYAVEHHIDLLPGTKAKVQPLRRMSPTLLGELRKQLQQFLDKKIIEPSTSPFGSNVLFVKKKNGDLRMCVDYRMLNQQTVKDSYPLPNIDELLDQLSGAKYFTALDLNSGYHQIPVAKKDRHKTAFRTRYGSYQFRVMPFGLTNAPATFQSWMNEMLKPHMDTFVVVFLDDILIFSKTKEEHKEHVRVVLDCLKKNKVYLNMKKCEFFRQSTKFLGFVVTSEGIKPDQRLVEKIATFPRPANKRQIRSFLGAVGFYRRFIKDFAKIALPLTALTKQDVPFVWTQEAQQAYEILRNALTTYPVLRLVDMSKPFYLFTDASEYAVGGVLTQLVDGMYHPLGYYSKKLEGAELKYSVYEKEFLAMRLTAWRFRSYLLGQPKNVVFTDHRPLTHLPTQKDLNGVQSGWLNRLADFNLDIQYIEGKKNCIADLLSRPPEVVLNSVAVGLQQDQALLKRLQQLYRTDRFIGSIKKCWKHKVPVPSILNHMNMDAVSEHNGLLYYAPSSQQPKRLIIPDNASFKTELLMLHHDNVFSGHPGRDKMCKDLARYYYWPRMQEDVAKYVKECPVCQSVKSLNQPAAGLLQPLPIPAKPWDQVTIDFITDLPLTAKKNSQIVVMVDKFTKCLTVAPAPASLDAKGTASIFLQYVYRLHGMPSSIVSDRDPKFTSQFWIELMSQLGCQKLQSTAYHPQTDGQTERVNRVLEDMIRCYCDEYTNTWDELLWPLEFAYNDSYQQSTKFTPFYLNYGRHPRKPHTIALGLEETERNTASSKYLDVLFRCHQAATHNMRVAQQRQAQYANKSRRVAVYKEGDRVLLSTHKLKWEGKQFKKLQPRWIGPFTVVRVIPHNAVELNSKQKGYAFHPVVNVDRLQHFHSRMNIDAMNHQLEREWDESTAANVEDFPQKDKDQDPSDDTTMNSDDDDLIILLDDE